MLVSAFKTLQASISDDTLPNDTTVYFFLNQIEEEVYNIYVNQFPNKFIEPFAVNVTNGTSQYTQPSDFKHSRFKGTGLFKLASDGTVDTEYIQTEFGSNHTGFYMDGTYINITPKPTSTDTLSFRYIPKRTRITADTDELLLPDEYENLYVEWFTYLNDIRDEDYTTGGIARDFTLRAKAIISNELKATNQPMMNPYT